jgi:predicted flap endonuclease-1-like 5' DNA nuclease
MSVVGVALVILGIAIGFIIAWIFGAGVSLNLATGLLLVIAGGVIGFIIEWLIDESIRKNRELQRQLDDRRHTPAAPETAPANAPLEAESRDSEALAEVLRQLKAIQETQTTAPPALVHDQTNSKPHDSETITEILRQYKDELHQLGEQLTAKDTQLETVRRDLESYQKSHPDDLSQIRGIGPVFQRKLRDIGVDSFKQLAGADPAQLRRMLGVKDWQRVNIGSWIEQARDWSQRI